MEAAVFATTFVLIALAELGDKTQLVTLALATRYRMATVLSGVFLATALLMVLAVGVGRFVYFLIPAQVVQGIAGVIFLGFGFLMLKGGDGGDDEDFKTHFNPFLTVFLAFLLAEFGDKTQLAAIPLAATTSSPLMVWSGATLGMVSANVLAVVLGNRLGERFSEKAVKRLAAGLFILFGLFFLSSMLFKV